MESSLYDSPAYRQATERYYELVNTKLQGASRVEARILGLDMLPRVMTVLECKADECPTCKELRTQLHETMEILPLIVDGKSTLLRRDFENQGKTIIHHLQGTHKMTPKGKMLSTLSLWCMVGGTTIGYLMWLMGQLPSWGAGIMLGWLIGTAIGTTVGKLAERKLRKRNLLY